jgi:hypothetical protein
LSDPGNPGPDRRRPHLNTPDLDPHQPEAGIDDRSACRLPRGIEPDGRDRDRGRDDGDHEGGQERLLHAVAESVEGVTRRDQFVIRLCFLPDP